MYISYELRVEGRRHSNVEGGSAGGAGAGGSIYVVVSHLDGAGSIETVGGAGKGSEFMSYTNFSLLIIHMYSIYKFIFSSLDKS